MTPMFEQLGSPQVQKALSVMNYLKLRVASNLEHAISEYNKIFIEAKDNAKFLSTLERHFKNIYSNNLAEVRDTLPSLMNAIRMVWIISRHYNRDERMVPLMARVSWDLAEKVSSIVNVKLIFQDSYIIARQKVLDSKELLECWVNSYFETREKIELSGRDQRWEFDRKRLFEKTNYMAKRCADILQILEVVDQFRSIFGPELKSVTGDPAKIDDVLKKVEALVYPFETTPFDVFSKEYDNLYDNNNE